MRSLSKAEVRRVIADALGLEAAEVGDDASMDTLEAWDSLGHLGVVMAIESSFGCRLAPAEVTRLTSVDLIAEYLGDRQREAS